MGVDAALNDVDASIKPITSIIARSAAGPTPAYGLFARHVDGLRLQNVRFELLKSDERPEMILEDVINENIGK